MSAAPDIKVNGTPDNLTVHAPGCESALPSLRAIIRDLARQVGFTEQEAAMVEMAVDEACANVVEHAYAPDKQWCWQHRAPEIRLDIRVTDGRLIIEINDHGQRFDFTSYRPADLQASIEQMKPGGYGIHIMRRFMDEVQYSSNDQTGNTLRLVKRLQKS